MKREEFAKAYLVALYRLHRIDKDSYWSVKEIINEYEVPRDPYFESEIVEQFEALGWARPLNELGLDDLSTGMQITFGGKNAAEKLIDDGFELFPTKGSALAIGTDLAEMVPASDRIVMLDDNGPDVIEARQQLEQLEQRLILANDVGDLSAEEVIAARGEVSALRAAMSEVYVRAQTVLDAAGRTLKWIGEKASAAAIGEIAKHALKAIAAALGFPVL